MEQNPENWIGETARMIGTRVKEHQFPRTSLICEHCQAMGHEVTPHRGKLQGPENSIAKCDVKEAIFMKWPKPSLSRNKGLDLLIVFWLSSEITWKWNYVISTNLFTLLMRLEGCGWNIWTFQVVAPSLKVLLMLIQSLFANCLNLDGANVIINWRIFLKLWFIVMPPCDQEWKKLLNFGSCICHLFL